MDLDKFANAAKLAWEYSQSKDNLIFKIGIRDKLNSEIDLIIKENKEQRKKFKELWGNKK